MRKKIMILGKSLITFSLLWPVPVGFVIYFLIYKPLCALFNWMVETGTISAGILNFISSTIISPLDKMPLWGVSHGYWWPLLYITAVGLAICLLSRYSSNDCNKKSSFNGSPLMLLLPLTLIGLGIVAVFWVVTLIIIALYHLFLTDLIEYSVPILFCAILLAVLIWIGIAYKRNWNKNSGDGNNASESMKEYDLNRAIYKQKELDKIRTQEERRKASQQRKNFWVENDE